MPYRQYASVYTTYHHKHRPYLRLVGRKHSPEPADDCDLLGLTWKIGGGKQLTRTPITGPLLPWISLATS